MFGNLIYFNRRKVEQYATLVQGKSKSGLLNITDGNEYKSNALLICSQFEELLKDSDDYFDFVDDYPEVSIKDVKVSSIIRVKGEVYVPDQFDIIHLIDEYKDQVLDFIDSKNSEDKDILKIVLNSSKMKVPIYCELTGECDFWLGVCKAIPENFMIDYNDIEDYEGTEFTILARLEARKYYKDTPLLVYDIYKDFLGLNRALRKQITSNKNKNEPFENISVDEDYLSLEILAIY